MSLRTKLLIGYLVFVAALVLLGGWSAWRLREMGGVSRRIIANNYDSVVAAQDMKESLERQDAAALFFLLGQREKAERQLREHRARFDAAFEKAAHNITEPGEPEVVAAIRRDRQEYYRLYDAFLADPTSHAARLGTGLAPSRLPIQSLYISTTATPSGPMCPRYIPAVLNGVAMLPSLSRTMTPPVPPRRFTLSSTASAAACTPSPL
jgi:hypothetical protein